MSEHNTYRKEDGRKEIRIGTDVCYPFFVSLFAFCETKQNILPGERMMQNRFTKRALVALLSATMFFSSIGSDFAMASESAGEAVTAAEETAQPDEEEKDLPAQEAEDRRNLPGAVLHGRERAGSYGDKTAGVIHTDTKAEC